MMKRMIWIVICFFCWSTTVLAKLSVTIQPEQIHLGQSVRLILTQEGGVLDGLPDLTPLHHDFTIQGTENSTSYTAINGQAKVFKQWQIILVPKRTGVLSIPAIRMGQQTTKPITVTVSDAPVSSHTAIQDTIQLIGQLSQKKGYVNEQLTYTVQLFSRQQMLDAEYHPPQVKGALLVRLGEERHYQTVVNGLQYHVDEQRYAIFPQRSGQLTLVPPELQALVYDSQPRRIHVVAKPQQLMIDPIPSSASQHTWLPSKQVTLTQHYDRETATLKQGDTLLRTITLKAEGVAAELLPALTFARSTQFGVYPEKPETSNQFIQHRLFGEQVVKVTYLLNEAGSVTIPALTVQWFNTTTRQFETAQLPPRQIRVEAQGVQQNRPQKPAQVKEFSAPQIQPMVTQPVIPSGRVRTDYRLTLVFGIAWGVTMLAWISSAWWRRRPSTRGDRQAPHKALRLACRSNHPEEARVALLRWATVQWPHTVILNLNDIARLVHDAELKQQLQRLSVVLYRSDGQSAWDGEALWKCISRYKPLKKTHIKPKVVLPE